MVLYLYVNICFVAGLKNGNGELIVKVALYPCKNELEADQMKLSCGRLWFAFCIM